MRRRAAAVVFTITTLGLLSSALANPFYIGRYRGLLGGPLDKSGFAIYWNPANMAAPGSRIALSLQGINRIASYDRTVNPEHTEDEQAANSGKNTTGAFAVVPALAGSYGFTIGDFDLAVGAAAYVARAGSTNWTRNPGADSRFPGAYDGPQRWSIISTKMIIATGGIGFAAHHKPTRLWFGITPQFNRVTLSTLKARNLDGTDSLLRADGHILEGRVLLKDASATGVTILAGMRWDATDAVSIGISWQQGKNYQLSGKTLLTFSKSEEIRSEANFPMQVAGTLRASVGVQVTERLTLRPEFEWSDWSRMDRQVAINDAGDELIAIERNFKDTWTGRLRADFSATKSIDLHGGFGFETGATPVETHEPGLAENHSWELGIGASFALSDRLALSTSFIWHQYLDQTVKNSIQTPTSNGKYTDARQYLSIDLEVAL